MTFEVFGAALVAGFLAAGSAVLALAIVDAALIDQTIARIEALDLSSLPSE